MLTTTSLPPRPGSPQAASSVDKMITTRTSLKPLFTLHLPPGAIAEASCAIRSSVSRGSQTWPRNASRRTSVPSACSPSNSITRAEPPRGKLARSAVIHASGACPRSDRGRRSTNRPTNAPSSGQWWRSTSPLSRTDTPSSRSRTRTAAFLAAGASRLFKANSARLASPDLSETHTTSFGAIA